MSKIGVDLAALAPEAAPPPPAEPVTVGALCENDCDAEAWQVLLRAARSAADTKAAFVGTPQLFHSLLRMSGSPLRRGLSFYAVVVTDPGPESTRQLSGKVACSDNLNSILLLAQANAAGGRRDRISAQDLLDAFIAQGGGEMGRHLSEQGILLKILVSDLFLEGGDVDASRFTEDANNVLEMARTCAASASTVVWHAIQV